MGNNHSVDFRESLHKAFNEDKDAAHAALWEKVRSFGMGALNRADAKKDASNPYFMSVDKNTSRYVLFVKAIAATVGDTQPSAKGQSSLYKTNAEATSPSGSFKVDPLPFPFMSEDYDLKKVTQEQAAKDGKKGDKFKLDLGTVVKKFNELQQSLPIVEKNPVYFDKRYPEHVRDTIADVFGVDAFPNQTVYWHYWNSEKNLERLAFHGVGSCK